MEREIRPGAVWFVVVALAAVGLIPATASLRGQTGTTQAVAGPEGGSAAGTTAGRPKEGEVRTDPPIATIAEYFGVTDGAVRETGALIDTLSNQKPQAVEFLVALVPDPIDSNLRWIFDSTMEAIQQAASVSNYALDRFYLPDWKPGSAPASGSAPGQAEHELYPGVVLFRKGPDLLLVVFTVPETATFGIHHAAFDRAISYIARWQKASNAAGPIRILGPNFSGTVDSLKRGIAEARMAGVTNRIHIVSGSATACRNKEKLESVGPSVTFAATVLPDNELLRDLEQEVLRLMPNLRPREVAFLIESSTVYGQEVGKSVTLGERMEELQPGGQMGGVDLDPCSTAGTGPFSDPQVFRFPMHISRLRSAAQQQRLRTAAAAPSSVPRALPLSMDDPGTGNDALPSFTPEMTSAGVEIALTRILEAVRRDRVRVVGLFATDTRDRLFLADLLRRAAPDVVLVTIESDLLFGHPDYLGAMRGALVASSYPLFSDTQLWASPGERTRVQFRTTNSQGTYNAALVLLTRNLDAADAAPAVAGQAGRLADYAPLLGACDTAGCLPSGWISIVGQDGLWPSLAAPAGDATKHYAFQMPPSGKETADTSARRAAMSASGVVRLAYVLLLVAMAAHVFAYGLARVEARRPPRVATSPVTGWPFFRNFGWESAREGKYVLALLAAFAMAATTAMSYAGLALELDVRLESPSSVLQGWWSAERMLILAGFVLWLALLYVTADLAVGLVMGPSGGDDPRAASAGARLRSWARESPCRAAAVTVGASLWLASAAFEIAEVAGRLQLPVPQALLVYERAVHPANGISPLLAIALITAVGYGWALVHLRRVRLGGLSETDDGFVAAKELGGGKDRPWSAGLPAAIASPTAALPPGWMALPLLATAATLGFVLQRPLFTFESPAFGWFFGTIWIAGGFLILLSLTQAAYLWRLVRDLLYQLAGHPAAGSYRRLPDSVIGRSLFARGPGPSDGSAIIASVRMLHYRHLQLLRTVKATSATASPLAEVGADKVKKIGDLICAANKALEPGLDDPAGALLPNKDRALGRLVSDLPAVLHPFWERSRKTDDRCQARWYAAAEETLALPVAFFLRALVSRVVNTLLFVVAGILMMVAAQAAYPFRPRQALLALAWTYFVVAIVVVVAIFVQMERSTVLSHLSSTTPGKVRWDSTFVARIVVYVIVPLLTLFAAQFPEVGRTFIDWLQPVSRALP